MRRWTSLGWMVFALGLVSSCGGDPTPPAKPAVDAGSPDSPVAPRPIDAAVRLDAARPDAPLVMIDGALPDARPPVPDAPVPDAPVPDAPVPDAPVPDVPMPDAPRAPLPDARLLSDARLLPDAPRALLPDAPVDARPLAVPDAAVADALPPPVDAPTPDAPLPDATTPVADTTAPTWPEGSALTARLLGPTSVDLSFTPAFDTLGVTSYRLFANGALLATLDAATRTYTVLHLATGDTILFEVEAGDAAGNWSTTGPSVGVDILPPSPDLVAPALDLTATTSFVDRTAFLYSGSDPAQVGVAPGTIVERRAAVLRGNVRTRDGSPLPGVTVTVHDHAEYGFTVTREDGGFDLAVNGGGLLTIEYQKDGVPSVQRQVDVPWQDFATAGDVVMVPYDANATFVDLTAGGSFQVARGSLSADTDGARQETLLFAPGTAAVMTLPDGTTQPLDGMTIRATEYTVGDSGPEAMPSALPATSGYTYAVELSVDEAVAAGAVDVQLTAPVIAYVDNFLDFPVGVPVPLGYYDRAKGAWIADDSGRVIALVDIADGLAIVDTDGDGAADDGLGMSDDERRQLATLYAPGQSLWRTPIHHFSPWDKNWPLGSDGKPAEGWFDEDGRFHAKQCIKDGSIIGCEDQTLGESVPIVGTPYALVYQSDRVPGRKASYSEVLRITSPTPPADLRYVELTIEIAGRIFRKEFSPAASQYYTFTWDGNDAYGRRLQGRQPVTYSIGYAYDAVYIGVERFSRIPDDAPITPVRARKQVIKWDRRKSFLGAWHHQPQGLGGLSLSVHHSYDPSFDVLYRGDGETRSVLAQGTVIKTVAGNGDNAANVITEGAKATATEVTSPWGVAAADDGGIYVASYYLGRVYRIDPDGTVKTVAGKGNSGGLLGDDGPALSATLSQPQGLALGPDGSLYVADTEHHRIRRIDSDGVITTVAGTSYGYSGDGGPAVVAKLHSPCDVAVAPDGTLYIADTANSVIRYVGTDGLISTVAGNYHYDFSGDGGRARVAALDRPHGVALGSDGSLYIADTYNNRVRRVDSGGIIRTMAGGAPAFGFEFEGGRWVEKGVVEGGSALDASLSGPTGIAFGPDGSLYISDSYRHAVRRVRPDGILRTVAGNGKMPIDNTYVGEDGPPTAAQLYYPQKVAVAPDGSLLLADNGHSRVHRVATAVHTLVGGEFLVPDEDGGEVYVFDKRGRHSRTLDGLTATLLRSFTYDDEGRLVGIADGDGNTTTIERDGVGIPLAIVGPYGHRTTLQLGADGYLSQVTSPMGAAVGFTYLDGGLLATMVDAGGGVHRFDYDDAGRLIRDTDAAGASQTLARVETETGHDVQITSALGRVTHHVVQSLVGDARHRVVTGPDGTGADSAHTSAGATTTALADGTVVAATERTSPRWGMRAPYAASVSATSPGGIVSTITAEQAVTLADPSDPLSVVDSRATVSRDGKTVTTRYVAASRQVTTTSAAGRTVTTTLDAAGRVSRTEVPGLEAVDYEYDGRGRLAKTIEGERVTSYAYDARGNLASVTDPLGSTAHYEYDDDDRIIAVISGMGQRVAYSYNPPGDLLSLTPPGKPAHHFEHDITGLVTAATPPTVGAFDPATTYAYDLEGAPTGTSTPDGVAISVAYDAAGRLASLSWPGDSASYAYDAKGRVSSAVSESSALSFAYDGSLPTRTTWTGAVAGDMTVTFNTDLTVATESINGSNVVGYEYDADGLPTRVGGLVLSRNASNGLLDGTAMGVVSDGYTYDSYGQVVGYTARAGDREVLHFEYRRDAIGRIAGRVEVIDGESHSLDYTYDADGRLTDVLRDGSIATHYEYDANGNRLSKSVGATVTAATYDAQDRLLSYGDAEYLYTASGDLSAVTTPAGTTTYQYDAMGRLVSVGKPDGTAIEYLWDAAGNRIGKKVNGTIVHRWLGDVTGPAADLDAAGNVVARMVLAQGPNGADYLVRDGVSYRILADQVGSPRLVVNADTGDIAQRMDYDEFGNVVADTNPGFTPFGFAGGLYDADTGLVRFGARDYDPGAGRWTAKDPIGFAGEDANLYRYVFADPVNRIDPSGKIVPLIIGAVFTAWAAYDAYQAWMDPCANMTEKLGYTALALLPAVTKGVAIAIRVARAARNAAWIERVVASSARLGPKGVVTEGARAIAKKLGHAGSQGIRSAFEGVARTQEAAAGIIRDIMGNPVHKFVGREVIDLYNAAGQGVRINKLTDGFIGFLEGALRTQ